MNHFYAGQIILTCAPIGADLAISEGNYALIKKWITTHSNSAFGGIPPNASFKYAPGLAAYHNLFYFNIAPFIAADGSLDAELFDHAMTQIAAGGAEGENINCIRYLKMKGGSYPFWRVYVSAHGLPADELRAQYASYGVNEPFVFFASHGAQKKIVRVSAIAQIILKLFTHPTLGIFFDYPRSQIQQSPLRCRISTVACYSSADTRPQSKNPSNVKNYNDSIAGELTRQLAHSPIPYEVLGRIYAVATRDGKNVSAEQEGILGALSFLDVHHKHKMKHTMIKTPHIPTLTQSSSSTQPIDFVSSDDFGIEQVVPATYEKPTFPENPSFDRIYTLLWKLQIAQSTLPNPANIKMAINAIMTAMIHRQRPISSREDVQEIYEILRTHVRDTAKDIDTHRGIGFGKTKTRIFFDKILSELS